MIDACLERDPIKRPTAEVLLKDPFFKSVRKHWISSHPEAVLIKDHMTKVTGGSLILKELISHLMDVHTRSTAAITAIPLAQPTVENAKNLTVQSNNEESEMDDSVSLSTQGENGSQSSWDFDEENSSKNTTQELQSIAHESSENQPKEICTSEGKGLSEELPIEAKQTPSSLVGEIPLSSGHTSEEQLSQSIGSEVVRKGRFSVIDTVTPSQIIGPNTATTSTTGNSTVQGTPILSTISPNNILEESITSESKQPSSRPAVPESRRFPLTESRSSESRVTPVESKTTITESDESLSRKPGMTLEKKGSRFKITNEQLVASLITSPSQLPALADVLKMVKDLEKCIISLYEDNEALRKNLTALTTPHQHSHSDVSSPQADIATKKNSPSEAPIILPDSTTDNASKIMDHKKSVTFQE